MFLLGATGCDTVGRNTRVRGEAEVTLRPKLLALAFAATLGAPLTAASAEAATRPAGEIWRDCPQCPEMVAIPSGRFEMGSSDKEAEREGVSDRFAIREQPIHTVTIARPFALGRYPVTKREFADFVADTGFEPTLGCMVFSGSGLKWDTTKSWRDPGFDQTDRDPVVCTDWTTANIYVAWLRLKSRTAYRLPSESEWEYAARAGTVTTRPWDDPEATVCEFGNVNDRSSVDANQFLWSAHACEDGWAPYRISKTALNALTRILAAELKDTNILVNAVCPGWVRTDMGGPNATRRPEEAVDTIAWLATLPDGGPSGGFFRDREPIPW